MEQGSEASGEGGKASVLPRERPGRRSVTARAQQELGLFSKGVLCPEAAATPAAMTSLEPCSHLSGSRRAGPSQGRTGVRGPQPGSSSSGALGCGQHWGAAPGHSARAGTGRSGCYSPAGWECARPGGQSPGGDPTPLAHLPEPSLATQCQSQAHMCTCVYRHGCTHIHTHIHMHTHAHTHIPVHLSLSSQTNSDATWLALEAPSWLGVGVGAGGQSRPQADPHCLPLPRLDSGTAAQFVKPWWSGQPREAGGGQRRLSSPGPCAGQRARRLLEQSINPRS